MDDTSPKPFVLVLMPFNREFTDIYEVGIKSACNEAGAYCERIDEQIFVENILERLYNQIAKADIIVAEMTGRNPNVFYETGYAHALNKQVILLTKEANDIPFDLKHYPHIIYENSITTLKSQLKARINWCIDNSQKSLRKTNIYLDFFINGIPLINSPTIELPFVDRTRSGGLYTSTIKLAIHNKTNKIVSQELCSIALILPNIFKISCSSYRSFDSYISFNDEQFLWNLVLNMHLFPDAWDYLDISVEMRFSPKK